MLRFGWDFERLEKEGRCAILAYTTTKESGIQRTLDAILGTLTKLKAKRLVIDSFTSMSMAMKSQIDVRHLIHLLYHFLQQVGCTTLIITDTPYGTDRIGSSVEEFIADGIIQMSIKYMEVAGAERTLRVLKMRSTNHSTKIHKYVITEKGVAIQP